MAKLHQQQHRPRRDERKARERDDLKRENNRLRRENARIRRDAEKVVGSDLMFRGTDVEGAVLTPEVLEDAHRRLVENVGAPKCTFLEGCPGTLRLVDLGRFKMLACPVCKRHQKADGI